MHLTEYNYITELNDVFRGFVVIHVNDIKMILISLRYQPTNQHLFLKEYFYSQKFSKLYFFNSVKKIDLIII